MLYWEITKRDEEQRIVVGVASTEAVDSQGGIWQGQRYDGDIVESAAVEEALDEYLTWANIREMHDARAVGVVVQAKVEDKALVLTAKIVDDGAWKKIKAGVYRGFSLGGRVLAAVLEQLPDGRLVRRIVKLFITEISLVDRPANPEAVVLFWKGDSMNGMNGMNGVLSDLQRARDECELNDYGYGAELLTQAIGLVLQAIAGNVPAVSGEMGEGGETVQKLGRTVSENMGSLHKTVRALVAMMAGMGDTTAREVMGLYATPGRGKEEMQMQLQLLNQSLETLEKRLGEMPASGGPVVRAEKRFAIATGIGDVDEVSVLQKMIVETANPLARQALSERLALLQIRRNQK